MRPPPLPEPDSVSDGLDGFLSSRRPRRVPWRLRWRAKAQAASLNRLAVGAVFTFLGTIIAAVSIPWRLPQQWRLAFPDGVEVSGVVERVEDDPSSPYTDRAVAYEFSYGAPDGRRLVGRCHTSGPRWDEGAALRVRCLSGHPELALPVGARFDENGWIGLLAMLPAGVGYGMFFGGLGRRWRAVRLLRDGEAVAVRITRVEATRLAVNGARSFQIEYVADGDTGPVRRERQTDPDIVSLAKARLATRQRAWLLGARGRPRQTVWIETLW